MTKFQEMVKKFIPDPKRKLGVLQVFIISNQAFNQIPTYCRACKERVSFKVIDGQGSFTRLCKCGCRILKSCPPDENHKTRFYLEKFISKNSYDKRYKDKTVFERAGMKKIELNNKTVFVK